MPVLQGLTTAVDLIKGVVRGIRMIGDLVGPSDSIRKSNKYNELTPALPSFLSCHVSILLMVSE